MKKAAALLLLMCGATSALAAEYRFDNVKRTVTLKSQGKEQPATKGAHAHGGDKVETGWFSSALIASDEQRARFEIYSASEVTLAEDTPGVILSLERGRIRAAFDKITGSEPRIVKTPGALLAVRGTQFDVHVDRDGNTTVDVWEGLVEVRSPLHPDPFFVKPGEEANFGRDRAPEARPMPESRRREDPNRPRDERNPNQQRPHDPNRDGGGNHPQPRPPKPPA